MGPGFNPGVNTFYFLMEKLAKFESGFFYHVYNRAVGNEFLFFEEGNYGFFLYKLDFYMKRYLQFYALLRNHFHLLVRVPENLQNADVTISEQFRRFFISYTQAINVRFSRRGTLFMKPFKRKKISDDDYLHALLHYLHYNPVYHGVTKDYKSYKWTSYRVL